MSHYLKAKRNKDNINKTMEGESHAVQILRVYNAL